MPRINRRTLLAAAGLAAGGPVPLKAEVAGGPFALAGLKTEYIDRPLGLETPRPRFAWRLDGAEPGLRQAAWRITVASGEDRLAAGQADLWDSGRIADGRTFEVEYAGRPLVSAQRAWWRVQAWDAHGRTAVSAPSWFEMGLLDPADWVGDWLEAEGEAQRADRLAGAAWIWGPDPLAPAPQRFRAELVLPAEPRSATLLVSAKDRLAGVWVNGEALPLSGRMIWGTMTPLACALRPGRNVICIEAHADTAGFFPVDGGAMAALLKAEMADGTTVRLPSGPAWRASTADAPGWTEPGFDDSAWAPAGRSGAHVFNDPLPPGPAMLARRAFRIDRPVARARLYETALGAHDARINGRRVDTARLAPEISVAADHVLYQVYDVTPLLRTGDNALGVVIGDGWYAGAFGWRSERFGFGPPPRRYRAQLVIDHVDGSRQVIATGPNWRMSEAPILASEIYNGEVFDARLRQPGWDTPDFPAAEAARWRPMRVGRAPSARLAAQAGPPIRGVTSLRPRSVSEVRPGVFVFDFGQNFAGWCRLKAKGAPGATVRLRFAEILLPTGEVDQSNLRQARATDSFTLRGDVEGESFEPHFTYHGFRYVQVEGYPGRPGLDALEGVVAHSDCAPTGAFAAANPLVQQIWSNALWSQRSNFFGVPTDCPQRDERMGWMGDIQVFLDAAAFNMDVDAFIRRFTGEIRAAQTPEGGLPIVTPQPLSFPNVVTAGWSEAGLILPWTLYRRYGDTRVVDENWSAMGRWMDYVGEANPDFVWRNRRGLDLGDWLSVDARKPDDETTPRMLCATAYWAYVAELMAEMAAATGRPDEARRYARLRADIGRAFEAAFVRADGHVGNGSQTSYVLALRFGLVPPALRAAAAARLADDIRGRGMKLSTGFLGTPYLLDVLADNGQADVAVGLLLQTGYPSWGYMIRKGATTMWERWNGDVGDVSMNSYNHYAFGAVVGFLYRRLAGIAPAAPGFRRIEVRPLFDPRIGAVRAAYDSVVGRISTEVDGDDAGLARLALTVPANTAAEVTLPARPDGWRLDGRPLTGGAAQVQAGRHLFTAA